MPILCLVPHLLFWLGTTDDAQPGKLIKQLVLVTVLFSPLVLQVGVMV